MKPLTDVTCSQAEPQSGGAWITRQRSAKHQWAGVLQPEKMRVEGQVPDLPW